MCSFLSLQACPGAGKSLCVKYFEDIGFFVVNLPPPTDTKVCRDLSWTKQDGKKLH